MACNDPALSKWHTVFARFNNDLNESMNVAFEKRLTEAYNALGITTGDISPIQSIRLSEIIECAVSSMSILAMELARQNTPKYPRCAAYDDLLAVLHKMRTAHDRSETNGNYFTVSFGNEADVDLFDNYGTLEDCIVLLLEATAQKYGPRYDYSDDTVILSNGQIYFKED